MKAYPTDRIRNIALVGHSGSGKTDLTEAILYKTGVTNRIGRTEEGNTVSDFQAEEKKRKSSIGTTIIPIEWEDTKINFIDTPGYFDFQGEVFAALRAAEAALIVVDGVNGVEVGTEKVLKYTDKIQLPRIIFVNKIDKENADYEKIVHDLKNKFSNRLVPFTLPIFEGEEFKGIIDVLNKKAYTYENMVRTEIEIPEDQLDEVDAAYNDIAEVVAEAGEELMDKYFSGETFTHEELMVGIVTALIEGAVVPLLAGSADSGVGVDLLLDIITKYMPTPDDDRARYGFRHEDDKMREVNVDAPMAAVVFKTIIDPFVGKISVFKVISGKITRDVDIYNVTQDKTEKIGGLFFLRGNEQIEASEIVAGDIGAISKFSTTATGDTLATKNDPTLFKKLKYPRPNLFIAVEPVSKGDEDKISSALAKLQEEDPSFVSKRDPETKQLVIGGQGNVQLHIIRNKLLDSYGVETKVVPFKIAYRETIRGKSDVQGKHKKQSGGAGQYGDVHIRFEPTEEDFVFDEEVFGGSVPKNYFPAVEKGLQESMQKGPLAGYPVVGVKATLYDGSYHAVDSNEMAFKLAAQLAFRKGIEEAQPILLEPIMKVEINVPEEYMGDVMGDMNKRRGRILGMEPQEDGSQTIVAEAPHAELFEYSIDLRSMTQARGNFFMEFERYEEAPHNVAEKIIEASKED